MFLLSYAAALACLISTFAPPANAAGSTLAASSVPVYPYAYANVSSTYTYEIMLADGVNKDRSVARVQVDSVFFSDVDARLSADGTHVAFRVTGDHLGGSSLYDVGTQGGKYAADRRLRERRARHRSLRVVAGRQYPGLRAGLSSPRPGRHGRRLWHRVHLLVGLPGRQARQLQRKRPCAGLLERRPGRLRRPPGGAQRADDGRPRLSAHLGRARHRAVAQPARPDLFALRHLGPARGIPQSSLPCRRRFLPGCFQFQCEPGHAAHGLRGAGLEQSARERQALAPLGPRPGRVRHAGYQADALAPRRRRLRSPLLEPGRKRPACRRRKERGRLARGRGRQSDTPGHFAGEPERVVVLAGWHQSRAGRRPCHAPGYAGQQFGKSGGHPLCGVRAQGRHAKGQAGCALYPAGERYGRQYRRRLGLRPHLARHVPRLLRQARAVGQQPFRQ